MLFLRVLEETGFFVRILEHYMDYYEKESQQSLTLAAELTT